MVFTGSLGTPENNLHNHGAMPWTDLGHTFAEHGWVELRTSGQVQHSVNGAAADAACTFTCVGHDVWPVYGSGSTGAAGMEGVFRIRLAARESRPGEDDPGVGLVKTGDDQVYTLVQVGPGSRLWAGRGGIAGVRGGEPWYFLSGNQRVEVKNVTPVQVQPNKTSFKAGEVLTWTTQLYPGVGELYWGFESPGYSYESVPCRDRTICEWAPPRPGRMRVDGKWTAAWPGASVYGYSAEVTDQVQQPKLKLECTGAVVGTGGSVTQERDRVTRGQEMECVASADPSTPGAVTETTWEFAGEGSKISGPAGALDWGGVMVVGGTISVSGQIDGRKADPASISVTVDDREWKIDYPAEPQPEYTKVALRYPPVSPGTPELGDGILGKYIEVRPSMGYQDGSGPNEGWWFIAPLPGFSEEPALWLNAALDPRDPFYRAQQGRGGTSFTRPLCGQDFMRLAARHVLRHEREHHRVAESFFEGRGSTLSDEARVYDPDNSKDIEAELVAPIIAELDSLQAAHDRGDKLNLPCDFTYVTR